METKLIFNIIINYCLFCKLLRLKAFATTIFIWDNRFSFKIKKLFLLEVFMNKKLLINVFVINLFSQNFIYSINLNDIKKTVSDNSLYILGSVSGATFTWALIERFKKNKATQDIKKLKLEVDRYRSEKDSLEKDQNLLKDIALYFDKLDQEYKQDMNFYDLNKFDLESFINKLKSNIKEANKKLNSHSVSPVDIQKLQETCNVEIRDKNTYFLGLTVLSINEIISNLLNYKEKLNVKLPEWNSKENRKMYLNNAQVLTGRLGYYLAFFEFLSKKLNIHEKYIFLKLVLDNNYENKYSKEIELFNSANNLSYYEKSLDNHILSLYSQVQIQFPYLEYAQKLSGDRNYLKLSLDKISNYKPLPFEEDTFKRAEFLDRVLKTTFDFVVTTEKYLNEKSRKPEFDKQEEQRKFELKQKEERLKVELKEKEAKIEKERQAAQAILEKEQNKAKELANKEAELKKAQKELEVREKEINLSWARIREGDSIRENDRFWQRKIDELNSKYNKALRDYNDSRSEVERVKSDYKNQISDLNSQVRNLNNIISSNNSQVLQQEINRLKSRISSANQYISELENKLNMPPFNPESVDYLPGYLLDLKNKTQNVKNSLR